MLKIGDFSRLSQVPIKTLRYYDEIGLLAPVEVDRFTGYRYYSASQLPRLNRLLALKELGFSLEQIGQVLNEGVTVEQLRGMLRLKQAEAQLRVAEEQERLARIEARLRHIEMEATMSKYDVVIKKVEPMRVASVRDVIPTYSQQGGLWGELYAQIGMNPALMAGPCLTLYHDEGYKEHNVDTEVCQPIRGEAAAQGRVKVYDLPAMTAACAVHHGPYVTLSQAYEALMAWVEANSYRIVGSAREIYLQTKGDGNQNDPDCVTEIQIPMEKA